MDNRDVILKFLMDNKKNSFHQKDLKKRLLVNLHEDVIKDLLHQIIDYNPNLMHVYNEIGSALPVEYSGLIDSFLENGGFTRIESEQNNKQTIVQHKEDLQLKLQNLQIESLEYQKTIENLEEELKIASLIKNWWGLIISAIGAGIAIGKFLV